MIQNYRLIKSKKELGNDTNFKTSSYQNSPELKAKGSLSPRKLSPD